MVVAGAMAERIQRQVSKDGQTLEGCNVESKEANSGSFEELLCGAVFVAAVLPRQTVAMDLMGSVAGVV